MENRQPVGQNEAGRAKPHTTVNAIHCSAWGLNQPTVRRLDTSRRATTSRMFSAVTDLICSSISKIIFQSATVEKWLREHYPQLHILSMGKSIDVYKDTGHPREITERYHLEKLEGTHCVGHTRMATESAVTPAHSHPYTAGEDFCLVHNGSLSNPHDLRRMLEKKGIEFETDNDTEAACRYLQWHLEQGATIETGLEAGFNDLDGFYTLLMATTDKIVLVRDAFACKPAIVAERDDYVAIGSEFRALAHLPGIEKARLFEPKPGEIYSWKV